jgi:hypothetical protein
MPKKLQTENLSRILSQYHPPEINLPPELRKRFNIALRTHLDHVSKQRLNQLARTELKMQISRAKKKPSVAESKMARAFSAFAQKRSVPTFPFPTLLPLFECKPDLNLLPELNYVKAPPFSFGYPDPEKTIPAPPEFSGSNQYSVAAFPQDGLLSLGAVGGRLFLDGVFTGMDYPMIHSWLFGDAVVVSAHITQVFQIGADVKNKTSMRVIVDGKIDESDYTKVIYCYPGLPSSIANGLIAVVGWLYLTLSVDVGSAPVTIEKDFMHIVVTSDENDNPVYVRTDYDPCFSGGNALVGSIPINSNTNMAVINVAAYVQCLRAGVNNPGGGFVGIDLRDRNRTRLLSDDLPYGQNTANTNPTPIEIDLIRVQLL